ncbi:MAG: SGNH/GDSL hydrolase family protein [Clostridia bacterium]|nr:SGNH/GDSL hydrolase family protein [Clostridia bacterium]
MELKNKKILFLGDSITQGVGASSPETAYVSVFGALSGASVMNFGVSGTRIAEQKTPSNEPSFDETFERRAERMPSDADVVVVFGGTNDFGHGDARFGCFEDRDKYSFYGALHSLLRMLIEKYPSAYILYMSPLHRLSENATVNEIGIPCHPMKDYVEAIREVCEYYAVPLLDLYAISGMQPAVPIVKELYMPDGLHPSDAGAARIARLLLSHLEAVKY